MFTGIIERVGTVAHVHARSDGARIALNRPWTDLSLGESVAVNGVCLTVAEVDGDLWSADISSETLERSTLGTLRTGDSVHLERALRLGDRLGGHIVQGHVDEVGSVVSLERDGRGCRIEIAASERNHRYLAEKGSVAVDGVSLTVAALTRRGFVVALIPFTLAQTTLNGRRAGDRVNLEYDALAKYVERLLSFAAAARNDHVTRLDAAFLAEHGYL